MLSMAMELGSDLRACKARAEGDEVPVGELERSGGGMVGHDNRDIGSIVVLGDGWLGGASTICKGGASASAGSLKERYLFRAPSSEGTFK